MSAQRAQLGKRKLALTVACLGPLCRRHQMPQPEPPVPTALVVVAVPSTFQENDPPPGSVRLPQVEPSLGSVVARDRPVAQVDPLQAPLLLEPVLLQNLDQLLDRVALDRCRAGGHRDGVPRPLLGGYRQHEGRQAYRDL